MYWWNVKGFNMKTYRYTCKLNKKNQAIGLPGGTPKLKLESK